MTSPAAVSLNQSPPATFHRAISVIPEPTGSFHSGVDLVYLLTLPIPMAKLAFSIETGAKNQIITMPNLCVIYIFVPFVKEIQLTRTWWAVVFSEHRS